MIEGTISNLARLTEEKVPERMKTMAEGLAMKVLTQARKAVVGKDQVVAKALLAILAGGHILMEDIPGVGKTTLALAFSKALGLTNKRVQFTPDVMPSDLTGFSVFNKETGRMEYQPGALLCNLFLADELNRATSRTQSALLEAMEEGQVTVDGVSRAVPQPFLVIATQNPAGASGTQPLPDSQMDRFMVRLSLGYPDREAEVEMLRRKQKGNPLDTIEQVASPDELEKARRQVAEVYLKDEVAEYIVALIAATRADPLVHQGGSPRATLAVASMARASAWVMGRDYVLPEDVERVFRDTVAHRLLLTGRGSAEGADPVANALGSVPAPKVS